MLDGFLAGNGPYAIAVSGAPGVGKSALTGHLCHRARESGWRVVRAVGVPAEQPFALGGLNQIAVGLRDGLGQLRRHDRDLLAAVFGADPDTPPGPIPLAVALINLLGAAGAECPVLLMVDDVHWFDTVSSTVLSAAGRRATDPRVRILVNYRSSGATVFETAGWAQLAVGPLGVDAAEALVRRIEPPLPVPVRQRILALAEGNPLALQELPRSVSRIGTAGSAIPLTDRLVAVFGDRLEQLDPEVRRELLRSALDGSAGSAAHPGTGPRYVMRNVQEAMRAGLLTADPLGDPMFRHPLVRAAVIHQASAQERRDAHRHLATLYEDVLARCATHLGAAATVPEQDVADLLEQAALQSIRRGGATVAVDWLRRAAELCTEPVRRSDVLAHAAFVASQAGRFEDAQTLVDATQSTVGDAAPVVLTDAYLALYRDGDVTAGHRRVLSVLQNGAVLDDTVLTRLVDLALVLAQYSADPDQWARTTATLESLGDRIGEKSLIFRDAWGDVARTGHSVRARLAGRFDGLEGSEPWETMRLAVAAYYVDALGEFRTTIHALLERERERGAVTTAMTLQHLAFLDALASGQWADARQLARDGLQLSDLHRNELFSHQFAAYLGVLEACTGDVDAARARATTVSAWAAPRGLGLLVGYADRITVLCALADGDYQAAYFAALRAGAPGSFPPFRYQAVDGLLDLVEAAVHTGRLGEARSHAAEAARLRLADISPRLDALTTAITAMSEPGDEAGPLYERALGHPALPSMPFEGARIRLAYGMWLRRRRRRTSARDELARAADTFDGLGATSWAHRARAELRAAGAVVKPVASKDNDLSPQERTIADLAAAGHSNKQIAAQLYLSPRTVGAHLYRIFPKLGVTSRAGLASALRQFDEAGGPDRRVGP